MHGAAGPSARSQGASIFTTSARGPHGFWQVPLHADLRGDMRGIAMSGCALMHQTWCGARVDRFKV